jgi:iron complex outermembrane recepter protein
MQSSRLRETFLASTILAGLGFAAPAFAQDATPAAPPPPPQAAVTAADPSSNPNQEIVVTGSIFKRRIDKESPSPVTILTSDNLAKAGITTVADAVRSISADNSGSIPTAFSNGFGAGASGVSLRGLTVNSTLVLFDGIRAAYYPLADDGQRSFVDLNTIPDGIVDRVEVLKDGASSTYGADAIGGVVNVIIKKQITGIQGTAEGGISQRKDAGHQRITVSAGKGDLAADGWNAYVNFEYQHDSMLQSADRPFPYGTTNLSSIGGLNLNTGAASPGNTDTAVVTPATEATPGDILTGVPVPGAAYQILGGSCGAGLVQHSGALNPGDPVSQWCEEDRRQKYGTIQPSQTRIGGTAHLTARVGDNAQAYAMFTYYQDKVVGTGASAAIQASTPISTTQLVLPAVLSNGSLNPNDPYAAQGLDAYILYRFGKPVINTELNRTYRGAAGINGSFGDGWNYSFDATAMMTNLKLTTQNAINIQGLENAINDGTYNFVDPSANSQDVINSILPNVYTTAKSYLYMGQGVITKDLFQLPGGAFQLGVGGAVRYEKVNDPNQNANSTTLNLNTFSAVGHHTVESAYFEANAPILKQLEINASGRFDHYSEGYSHFSPKVGVKFTPIREVALRGTFSKGFRAPSFAETSGSVIGYAGAPALPQSVIDAHGNDAYVQPYSIGYNNAATPTIKPELSRSFTGGAVFQPTRWLSMTVDYYNIKKTRVISAGPQSADAISAYYAGTALPEGYTVTPNTPDPLHPNAIPTILFVNSPYVNAASLKTQGLDISATANIPLGDDLKLTSSVEVTDIFKYDFKACPTCAVQSYVGTEGPYQTSSGAGTPKWRGSWMNSLQYKKFTLTGTVYYTSGYKEISDDTVAGSSSVGCTDDTDLYGDVAFCHVRRFIDVDMVASYKVNDNFTFYANVLNLFDAKPPLSPANYAGGVNGNNYNPTYAQAGILGRYFRLGANFNF